MTQSPKITKRVGLLITFAVLLVACDYVPVHDVTKSFAIEVSEVSKSQDVIQLDFLWVVDNSPSMCQEQALLAASIRKFVDLLQIYLQNIDIRVAVTTTDAVGMAGKFANKPAKQFPPACFESRVHPCLANEDCIKAFGPGWECKHYEAKQMYNKNRSVNSTCIYRCSSDSDCCQEFCAADYEAECGKNESCLKSKCADAPNEICTFICRKPTSGTAGSGCLRPPDTNDCPKVDAVLSLKEMEWFKCNAIVEPEQSYQANIEQGLKAAWLALNPEGPNAQQAASFLRPNAYLIIVFISDEDDCSIDERFASPSYQCEKDKDCPNNSVCRLDPYFSSLKGQKVNLCFGTIKKDYYNICSLLGDFKGTSHHNCAYDLGCRDCQTDSDCDYGWKCAQGKKCRPAMYSLSNIASYQQPPGTPIFALTPVSDFYSKFRSLKADPAKVLIAVITGDGIPKGPTTNPNIPNKEQPSLISNACLNDDKLQWCAMFKEIAKTASPECIKNPAGEGCEDFFEIKRECIRECYIASKGDPQNPMAKNSYVCESPSGKADFGARYVRLAEMFGPNGVVENICAEEGIAPALESIAKLVIKRVTKICLPREYKDPAGLIVTKTVENEKGELVTTFLKQGLPEDGGDYQILEPTQDCCFPDKSGKCTGTQKAIIFNDLLEPTATIEVRYEADFNPEVKTP